LFGLYLKPVIKKDIKVLICLLDFDCSVRKFTDQWLCLKKFTFHLAIISNNCPGSVLGNISK